MQNEIELVIRIPEVDYVHFKELYESLPKDTIFVDTVVYYIGNGTPLDKVIEDIKAEIKSYVSEEPHQLMSKITVLEIIDKHREERANEDN